MSPTVFYVITKASWGGAQKYVAELMNAAPAHGYTPVLVYGVPGILAETDARKIRIPSLTRNISPLQDLSSFAKLYFLFRKERPDVVHLNSSKAGFVGALAARLARVPRIIFTAHGWPFNESREYLERMFFKGISWCTVLLSHETIAVSDAIARDLPSKKVKVVKNGIAPFPLLSREEARAALTIPMDAVCVGTIAELHVNKGIDVGIKAWKRILPKAEWVVIGSGEEETELREEAANLPIRFLGFKAEAQQYLRAFDLFLLPSRTEALAYVLLEAGMASVPAIASDVGGIPEIVAPGARFPVGSVRRLADLLETYIADPILCATAGTALKYYVKTNFPLEPMLEKTFSLYTPVPPRP